MTLRNLVASFFVLLLVGVSYGQVIIEGESGVPGDGIPDVYYDIQTGIITVDSDFDAGGNLLDIVAIFIGGPDITGQCSLCDNLPVTNPSELPGREWGDPMIREASTWTLGYSDNGSTQWIRTAPTEGIGFQGVVGEYYYDGTGTQQPWPADAPPFVNFPEAGTGIANIGPDNDIFENAFPSGTKDPQWQAAIGTSGDAFVGEEARVFYTNVTIVPEPDSIALMLLGCLGTLTLCHRSGR